MANNYPSSPPPPPTMEAPQNSQTHIAIFPTPGLGHLIPLIELARKLVHQHRFAVTFIIPYDGLSNTKQQKALLQTFPAVNSIFLPPETAADDLPNDANILTRILLRVTRSVPSLRKALSQLNDSGGRRLSAFLVDLFGTFTFDAVKEFGIPLYIFFPSTAMLLSYSLHLPKLDESCNCEYRDLAEPVEFPGCVPVRGSDLVDSAQDRKSEAYKLCLEMYKKYTLAEGILVNSFLDLEPETFEALQHGGSPPVYPVGPLIRPFSIDDEAECLKWLDEQPVRSVLFISFGSGGTLSTDQLKELALGLEMSEQRFLFVARRPDDKIRNAAFFTGSKNKMDPFEYFPSGFVERIRGKGFVLSHWAPQIEVLRHPATGGFLTHCGWNSTLESILNGVPLIAWPLYAEQRMNAVLLCEGLKVGFRVRENENGVVEREEISRLVRRLMEGEEGGELRTRMRDLKDAAGRALSEHGSSTMSLANVAEKWKSEIGLDTL